MNLPKGYKDTEVGIIPEDWNVKRVGDICDFIVPGRNKPRKFEGDIPWITTPDLEDGRSVSKSRLGLCISRDEAKNVGSKIVPAGSVLMSCAGELGIVAFTHNEIIINQQLHAFIPSLIIDGLFLLNVIKAQKKYIDGVATKTAVPYINKDNCNSIPIPVPPLPEQKAIALTLSDTDALIAACDRAITKKRNIKQGAMQQLLTGKKRLPGFSGEWVEKELRELTTLMTNGFVGKATSHYTTSDDGILYIQGFNVIENGFNLTGIKKVTQEFHERNSKSCLKEDDLLTIQTGDVGVTTVVTKELEGSNCHALIITRFKKDKIFPRFICQYFNSTSGRMKLKNIETGTTMKHINVGDLIELQILLPPTFPEQKAIAQILSDMDAEIGALEKKRDKYKAIKQGMMQELLTGKTRLNTDETELKMTQPEK